MEIVKKKGWGQVGVHRLRIPKSSRESGATILGSLDNFSKDKFHYTIGNTTDTQNVLEFLDDFEEYLSEEELQMEKNFILDNHKSHHSAEVVEKLCEMNFVPIYLPVSSSEYSSIGKQSLFFTDNL